MLYIKRRIMDEIRYMACDLFQLDKALESMTEVYNDYIVC